MSKRSNSMNGTQHNEIKNETDVNERIFFFFNVFARSTNTIITSFVRALPENIALGQQRPRKLVVTLTAANIFR